jgi:hypothetical protein
MNDDEKYEPNYDSVLKLDIWTIKQAVSLMFNTKYSHISKNLDKLDYYKKWKGMLHVAYTATGKSLEIETTGTDKGGNTQYVQPIVFLKWAKIKGYSIPEKLKTVLYEGDVKNPNLDTLRDTDVWSSLENKVIKVITEFPKWRNERGSRKITLTGNLKIWIQKEHSVNDREYELIKKVLVEVFGLSR